MRLDRAGVWSLPVVLLLGLVLSASVLSIGLASIERVQRVRQRQLAVEDFNRFLEQTQMLSAGGEGGVGLLELSSDGRIVTDGTAAELVLDGETLRVENTSLPISSTELWRGRYSLELKRGADGRMFIEVRGV